MYTPQIHSASSLRREIDTLKHKITQPETEESWDTIADALGRLAYICSNGGGEYPDELIPHLRTFARPICSGMSSERTRLSGVAIDLVTAMALALGGTHFEPLLPLYFPTLLILCSRTNRVIATRAKACIMATIEATQLPVILTYFVQNVKDKSNLLRLTVAEGTLCCLNCFNPPDIEKDSRAQEVETIIRTVAKDANADVRKVGKQVFEAYKQLLADRLPGFAAPLTPTIKKYLNIQHMPSTSQSHAPPPKIESSRPRGQLSKTRSISNLAASASSAPANPPPRPPSRSHTFNPAQSTGPSRATRGEPLATSSLYKEPQRIAPARTRTTSTTHPQTQPPSAPSRQPPQVLRPQRSIIGRVEHNGNPQSSSSHAKPAAVFASSPTEVSMKPPSSTQLGPRRVYAPQPPPAPPEPLRAPTPVSSATIPATASAPTPSSSSTSSKPAKVATSSAPAPFKPTKKPMLPPPVPTARERTISTRSNTSTSSTAKPKPDSSAATSATTNRGKERTLTQPTLAQLARMQTKKPAADNKAATKPASAASSKAATTAAKPASSKVSAKPQPPHAKSESTATVSSTSSSRLTRSTASSGAKGRVASKPGVPAASVKGKTVSSRPAAKQTQKVVEKKEPEEVPLPPSPVPGAKEEKPQEDVEVNHESDIESGAEIETESEGGEDDHGTESTEGERESHEPEDELVDEEHAHVDAAEAEDKVNAQPEADPMEHDEQDGDEDMDMSEATIIHHLDYKTNEGDATPEDDDEDGEATPRTGSPVVEHHLSQDLTTLTSQVTASAAPDSLNPYGYPTPPVSVSGSSSTSTANLPSQNGVPHPNGNGNGNSDSNPAVFATPHNAVNPDDLFALRSQAAKTPISALLSSIHHGFLFSPSSPLSPPSSYIVDGSNVVNSTHIPGQNAPTPLAKPQFGGSLNITKANHNFNAFGGANGWNVLEKQKVVKDLEAEFEEERGDVGSEAEKDMPREILKVVDVN